jgi:ABC-2 type transport system ATP-binding protein
MQQETQTFIEARELSKSFRTNLAVDRVSLLVQQGEIYGLVGPDGAGKTTFLRLLCGALGPTSGEAFISGFSVAQSPEHARSSLGYMPQRFSLYEELSVLENLRFLAEVRAVSREKWRQRSLEILEFVGLAPYQDRWAGRLSGGMKQKLGLAAALIHQPRVLLLDEPTTGVDPVTRQDFWQLIIRLVAEDGIAALVTTPYMDEASRCTRLGFMHSGRLLMEGSPAALRKPLQGRVLEVRGTPLRTIHHLAGAMDDVEHVQIYGSRLHLRVSPNKTRAVSRALRKKLNEVDAQIEQARVVNPLLEDVFHALLEDVGATPGWTAAEADEAGP